MEKLKQRTESKLTQEHITRMVSDFLDGKRKNIEHIEIGSGIVGLKKIYVIPIGTHHGRSELIPNVIKAELVTPDGKKSFGTVAIKHYKTVVKDGDAPALLPPTIAQSPVADGPERTPIPGKKLAVQMWVPDATAEEYLMEIAKIKHVWRHLVQKKPEAAKRVIISDIAPQNIKKWVVDLDVYTKDNAKSWDKLAINEFLEQYGDEAKRALDRISKTVGLNEEERQLLLSAAERKRVDDKAMEILEKVWKELPKQREFWEHHVEKDMAILKRVQKIARIPDERMRLLEKTANWLKENGHKNYPISMLHLAELERNIIAEWISAYKRVLEKWEKESAK